MDKPVEGPFCRISWHHINLNSHDQTKAYLLSKGWVPDEYNVKKENGKTVQTSPKLTESSFHTVEGDIPRLIARRAVLVHRQRMLKNTRRDGEESGWLNMLRKDGRLEARAIPQATPTGRARHSIVVNVPSPYAVYGSEFRSLFTTPEGYVLVGGDAAAIEARVFAHYMLKYEGGEKIAELILHGDIHSENAEMWGCKERNDAKSPMYALLYGAQIEKFSSTLGVDVRTGAKHYDAFWNKYKPLELLRNDLVKAWESRGGKKGGFIKGVDGRKLFARSPHSLINLLFQSTGSICVKKALTLIHDWSAKENLDATQVIFMHDEGQWEVLEDHAPRFKTLVKKGFKEAGEYFKLNVELDSDVKEGKTWADTH